MIELSKANHQQVKPTVSLTPDIRAHELLPPVDGQMSSHKIWIPPGTAYPPHYHPAPHVIVILEGGGSGSVGEPGKDAVEFPLVTGDVFYVPGKVRHQVGADERGMVMLAVSVGSLHLTDPGRLVVVD